MINILIQDENIVYETARNIDKTKLLRLAQCGFIDSSENILIPGSTDAGKSYIAIPLGYQACIEGYRGLYLNTTKLFPKLKPIGLKELAKIQQHKLIILDDFGL